MAKEFVAVRGVDEDSFKKLKMLGLERKMKVGAILSLAIKHYLNNQDEKNRKKKSAILRPKPFSWGAGSENTSEKIDSLLYGGNE
jgi:hypothetical protein